MSMNNDKYFILYNLKAKLNEFFTTKKSSIQTENFNMPIANFSLLNLNYLFGLIKTSIGIEIY